MLYKKTRRQKGKMKTKILLTLCFLGLLNQSLLARRFHYTIKSELPHGYLQLAEKAIADYHELVTKLHFSSNSLKAFTIIYSKTQQQTEQLLKIHGLDEDLSDGYYLPDESAIYVHQIKNNGDYAGFRPLIYQTICHRIHNDYTGAPGWFKKELAYLIGMNGHLIRGKMIYEPLKYDDIAVLREKIELGRRINIRNIFYYKDNKYYSTPEGLALTRTLFHWLQRTDELEHYLANVREKGYTLQVLEESLDKPFSKINIELMEYIDSDRFDAQKELTRIRNEESEESKKEQLVKLVIQYPDFFEAKLALGKFFYELRHYQSSRKYLDPIVREKDRPIHLKSLKMMANSYYMEQNYKDAAMYYEQALEYAPYDPFRYRLMYQIAYCYCMLEENYKAKEWFNTFLKEKWNENDYNQQAQYAIEYRNLVY